MYTNHYIVKIMNYLKLYNNILQSALNVDRKKNKDNYYEKHHIIPKCLGGTDDKNNLVLLTAKEHFVCHHLLTKIHSENHSLKFAFWSMCNQLTGDVTRTYKITSSVYEKAKIEFSKVNSIRHKGKKMPESHSIALSIRWKENNPHKSGSESHLFGIPRTDIIKQKISTTLRQQPERNPNYKGEYITPFGIFQSAPQAERKIGISAEKIRTRCKLHTNNKITKLTLFYNDDISELDLGKSWLDLGWSFKSSLT